jgi:hypothetical protein
MGSLYTGHRYRSTNKLVVKDRKGLRATSVFVALQQVWVANPRFIGQLHFWMEVWRGSCLSCVTAQETGEDENEA